MRRRHEYCQRALGFIVRSDIPVRTFA
jgi:hypothetical protein